MSLLIDQSWIGAWRTHRTSESHRTDTVEWFLSLAPLMQNLVERFPPNSLVRSSSGSYEMDVPFPTTLAIVVGYTQGALHLRQSPDAEKVLVLTDTLELACTWSGFTPDYFRACKVLHALNQSKLRTTEAWPARRVVPRWWSLFRRANTEAEEG